MTTDTNDLRETVAQAIHEKARPRSAPVWEDAGQGYRGRFYTQADAAIAAATPIIEAALLDRLIASCGYDESISQWDDELIPSIADWLRSQRPEGVDQPFDEALYDAVMARRSGDHADTSSDYWDGYEECARKAARIAAERAPQGWDAIEQGSIERAESLNAAERAEVSDEGGVWWGWSFAKGRWFLCLERECRECVTDEGVIVRSDIAQRDERRDALLRAVRAALAPAVPVIPDGWKLRQIVPLLDVRDGKPWIGFAATIGNGPDTATGEAVEWLDALTAAIQAAKDTESP